MSDHLSLIKMISWKDFYSVMSAMVPLYVSMMSAYASVKWWRIFTPDQCSGINRFVALFAIPLLCFHFIATSNPYAMNLRFIAADSLQKIIVLVLMAVWTKMPSSGSHSLDWVITVFSLSTLPNTLVVGIPLLVAMYGAESETLMVQIVVLQCVIWYIVLVFLLEYRAARVLILERFPNGEASSVVAIEVAPEVGSLVGEELLHAEGERGGDGKIRVSVRKCSSSRRSVSDLSGAEIYSLDPTPREPDFNSLEMYPSQGVSDIRHSHEGRELHVFVWSSNGSHASGEDEAKEIHMIVPEEKKGGGEEREMRADLSSPMKKMPPARVVSGLILVMVWRKIIRNPNTYASLLGLAWGLIAFRWQIGMPAIMERSITILSDAGLGMAMFSLGLFMASQPKIIACGNKGASLAMAARFLIGPAVMAAASLALGLRGTLLRIAIVQAALPQGIVTFVYAKEYNVHPEILSTGVIFGMIIALPVTLLYYIILGL